MPVTSSEVSVEPLVHIPFKRVNKELIPDSAMTIVTDTIVTGTSFDTHALAVTNTPTSVLVGHDIKVGAVYYPVSAVTATTIDIQTPVGVVALTGVVYAYRHRLEGQFSGEESFTRASSATYIDPLDGLVKTAAPNQMRFEKMSDGGVGVLLEGASTNLIANSSLSTLPLPTYGTGMTATYTNTSTRLSPDGITTLTAYDVTSNGNLYWVNFANTITVTQQITTYTGSFYVWLNGSEILPAMLANWAMNGIGWAATGVNTVIGREVERIGNDGWYRIKTTSSHDVGPGQTYPLVISTHADSLIPVSSGDVLYISGFQLEVLPFASSYIPTAGTAVTRAGDNLQIDVDGNWINQDFSLGMNISKLGNLGRLEQIISVVGDYPYLVASSANGNTSAGFGFGGADVESALGGILNANIIYQFGLKETGSDGTLYNDGVLYSKTQSPISHTNNATMLNINSTVNPSFVHIRNLQIFDKALTDAEMSAL